MDDRERDRDLAIIILEAIEHIQRFTPARADYVHYEPAYFAVHRLLHIISETITRLSTKFKELYPQVPWKDIHAFRNIIVHDYISGIDDDKIWEIIALELPALHRVMLNLVPDWNDLKQQRKQRP